MSVSCFQVKGSSGLRGFFFQAVPLIPGIGSEGVNSANFQPRVWESRGLMILGFILPTYVNPELHDDVIKWKHFPRYWPFERGIHQSPVNSPHKDQWHGSLMFSLIYARINGWVNNRKAVDLRRNRAHYDVIVMIQWCFTRIAQCDHTVAMLEK